MFVRVRQRNQHPHMDLGLVIIRIDNIHEQSRKVPSVSTSHWEDARMATSWHETLHGKGTVLSPAKTSSFQSFEHTSLIFTISRSWPKLFAYIFHSFPQIDPILKTLAQPLYCPESDSVWPTLWYQHNRIKPHHVHILSAGGFSKMTLSTCQAIFSQHRCSSQWTVSCLEWAIPSSASTVPFLPPAQRRNPEWEIYKQWAGSLWGWLSLAMGEWIYWSFLCYLPHLAWPSWRTSVDGKAGGHTSSWVGYHCWGRGLEGEAGQCWSTVGHQEEWEAHQVEEVVAEVGDSRQMGEGAEVEAGHWLSLRKTR